jgi:hypothetical protein
MIGMTSIESLEMEDNDKVVAPVPGIAADLMAEAILGKDSELRMGTVVVGMIE